MKTLNCRLKGIPMSPYAVTLTVQTRYRSFQPPGKSLMASIRSMDTSIAMKETSVMWIL